MTTTKTTYISTINAVLTAINEKSFEGITDEHVEKLIALGQQLEKRNSLSKLSSTEGKRCGDIATELGITGQKCSALLSQLVKTGEVVKTEEKRVAFFTLPVGG